VLSLLLRDQAPEKYGRAAFRWHGRYCREFPEVDLEEGQAVLETLAALRGPRAPTTAWALAELLDRRGLERAAEALNKWANRGPIEN